MRLKSFLEPIHAYCLPNKPSSNESDPEKKPNLSFKERIKEWLGRKDSSPTFLRMRSFGGLFGDTYEHPLDEEIDEIEEVMVEWTADD